MQNFEIAKVLKPQGIKGEIKVECFTSDFDFFKSLKEFYIGDNLFHVESSRLQNNFAYIKTREINDMSCAEQFRNRILTIEKPLNNVAEDEYYIADLEDCCVVDEFNNIVGYVESVEKYGSADIINVLIGGAVRSFPLLKTLLKEVDIKNKKIIVFKDKLDEVLV